MKTVENKPIQAVPIVVRPVRVWLDIPVFYATENGFVPSNGGIYCAELFSQCVLKPINEYCKMRNFSFVHIGCYNPRPARKKNGDPILDVNGAMRWSNHAFGSAIDAKGVILDGEFRLFTLKEDKEMFDKIIQNIFQAGKKPEIVDEKGWWHIGYFNE
jgi:hypothetical protein